MQINITSRYLKLSDSIDSYIRKKIVKVSKFYDGDNVWIHVILSIEKNRQITEIVFHIGKLAFRAKEQSFDLYTSIGMAINKLEEQLKKQKENSKVRRKNNLKVLKNKKHSVEKAFFLRYSMRYERGKRNENYGFFEEGCNNCRSEVNR
ncbi:MAG: ribosome-associated translation inhibitor RaiA [Endomicrobium sp.]|jgi:putative sigma-54 modulation protein|nr:ribosome-associated translation inhibitor RaiA [Endomicrobium sp.]